MLFRMNIRRTKGLVWLLNIAAILCITLTFVMIYRKKADGKFQPMKGEVFRKDFEKGSTREDLTRRDSVIDINRYSAIWNAPISGEKRTAVMEETDGLEEAPALNPIEDILQVRVILKSAVPEESLVRLYYPQLEAEETEKPFKLDIWNHEGDSLRPPYDVHPFNGKVLKILADEVIFSYQGEEVSLSPEYLKGKGDGEEKGTTDAVKAPPEIREFIKNPPAETIEFKPNHFFVVQKDYSYVRNDYQKELEKVTLASVKNPRTGKTELKLSAINNPSSLAAKHGFESGDTLISINGFPVHNKSGAINYFKEHPNEGKYTVVISRKGKQIGKTFYVPTD